jgi:hypothetical protein
MWGFPWGLYGAATIKKNFFPRHLLYAIIKARLSKRDRRSGT